MGGVDQLVVVLLRGGSGGAFMELYAFAKKNGYLRVTSWVAFSTVPFACFLGNVPNGALALLPSALSQ